MLAQLVEEVSVLASDMRRKKPRTIPRPKHMSTATGQDAAKKAVGVLARTRRRAVTSG